MFKKTLRNLTSIEKMELSFAIIAGLLVIPLCLFESTQIATYIRIIAYSCLTVACLSSIIRKSNKFSNKVFSVMTLILIIFQIADRFILK